VSGLAVVAAFIAVVNPARAVASIGPGLLRAGRLVALVGAAVAAAAGVVLVAVHEPILDGLSVSEPTFRLGAGLVVAAMGLRALLLAPEPWTEGLAGGRLAALVPIAFPVLIAPEMAVTAVDLGADEGTGIAVVGVLVAMALAAALGCWSRLAEDRPPPPWLVPLGRLLGAGAVVFGVARVVSGVFDV
jgi:small neutral amino acid transporter SnatA (MarC family)